MHDQAAFNKRYNIEDALDWEGESSCRWPACRSTDHVSCACHETGVKKIKLNFYNYLSLYHMLCSAFDKNDIFVYPSEMFRLNLVEILKKMALFLEIDFPDLSILNSVQGAPNENVQNGQCEYKRLLKIYYEAGTDSLIRNYYQEANSTMSKVLNLDLESYGY